MSLEKYEGGNIANVERVKLVPESGDAIVFETSTSCSFDAAVSSGSEVEQRVKNRVMGILKTDDLLKGYDLTLEDQRLIVKALELIDGGTATAGSGKSWTKYEGPTVGETQVHQKFDLYLYTSDRDTDGDVIEYYEWAFPNCKGKALTSGGASDGQFSTLRYTIESRPAKGTAAMQIKRVATLPEATLVENE